MGLYISSLQHIPENANRNYFIYLLDYGWNEPLIEALEKNYDRMAQFAAENNAVVIKGTRKVHFEDEVLSWHNINGENAEKILPAILITNRHPAKFKESFGTNRSEEIENDLKMILIPLKKFCQTTTDVTELISKLFNDIRQQKDLNDFKIAKEVKKGFGKALADSLILEPNFNGLGIDFKKIIEYFKK
ncbi:hypothetical protein [Epilithonimonas hungarica]|uniref:Uncharacterized protein n=1 Tax=Epilithonimonas hungarica TaxID=454006 RepID=A0A1G7MB13_9FLAO|nr:hypothetical protein [Epilithonimonas hungarica]SDF58942.1 hypothetical protein SAMN05421825_1689 [Epilithonimonas hungarica]